MELSPVVHIIRCPHCGGLHTDSSYVERKAVAAFTLWTDGVSVSPSVSRLSSPFIFCSYGGCEKTFWISDAEIVHTVRRREPYNQTVTEQEQKIYELWQSLDGRSYTYVRECYQAIDEGIAGESRENWKYLRRFVWHESIEPFRQVEDFEMVPGTKCNLSERHYNNLTELRLLLDVAQEDERLLAIEVNRQVGDFEAAANLVDFDWSDSSERLVDFQVNLIETGDMLLRCVPTKLSAKFKTRQTFVRHCHSESGGYRES